jgi:pentatricopeptide repeat protein
LQLHEEVIRSKVKLNIRYQNALLDFYIKTDRQSSAKQLLQSLVESKQANLVTFNTAISGFSSHRLVTEAWLAFENMQKAGIKPDGTAHSIESQM